MGGMVAQTMLRRRPDAYRAAVLACTSPAFGNADGEFQKKFVADRIGPLDAGKTMADLAPGLVARMVGPAAEPAGRAHRHRGDERGAASRPIARPCAASSRFDERANLASIRVPVLCLAGEADQTAPAKVMERMAARIPGARFACLPASATCRTWRRPPPSMLLSSTSCARRWRLQPEPPMNPRDLDADRRADLRSRRLPAGAATRPR